MERKDEREKRQRCVCPIWGKFNAIFGVIIFMFFQLTFKVWIASPPLPTPAQPFARFYYQQQIILSSI